MSNPTILTCAVTGSAPTHRKNPAVPITPKDIAVSAIDAARAGAAMVHIHVRDPVSGAATGDIALYREVHDRIADAGTDVIINISSGFGGFFVPDADEPRTAAAGTNLMNPEPRIAHVLEIAPEVCSLDVGTANFGDRVFMNTVPHLRVMGQAIVDAGVKPEVEVFEAGHIEFAKAMIAQGLLATPVHFQFCLGVKWCMPATAAAIDFMRSLIPSDATWSAFGIGASQFPIVEAAVDAGGHARVGLEDNLYVGPGELAPSNAALVEKAASIVAAKGGSVATPADARRILGLAGAKLPAEAVSA